jgi:hypothetical protein
MKTQTRCWFVDVPVDILQSVVYFLNPHNLVKLERTGNKEFIVKLRSCHVTLRFDRVVPLDDVKNMITRFEKVTNLNVVFDALTEIESIVSLITPKTQSLSFCRALLPNGTRSKSPGKYSFVDTIRSLSVDLDHSSLIGHLPASATKIRLPFVNLTTSLVTQLSTHLTSLTCSSKFDFDFSLLPSSLKKLKFERVFWAKDTTGNDISDFPPLLEHLEWYGRMFSLKSFQSLPRSLRVLKITRSVFGLESGATQAHLDALPQCLTELDIHLHDDLTSPILTNLKNLRKISFQETRGASIQSVPYWPPDLSSLALPDLNPNYFLAIDKCASLRHLEFSHQSRCYEFCLGLPSTLTDVTIYSPLVQFDSIPIGCWSHLSYLRTLTMQNQDISSGMIQLLPSSLTSLILIACSILDSNTFKHFPRSLTSLETRFRWTPNSTIQQQAIHTGMLPPMLRSLSLPSMTRQGSVSSSQIISKLPASLTELTVFLGSDVSSELVKSLPTKLQVLKGLSSVIRLSDLMYLPKLREIDIYAAFSCDGSKPLSFVQIRSILELSRHIKAAAQSEVENIN